MNEEIFKRAQKSVISFESLHRKSDEENLFVKKDFESLCNILTEAVEKIRFFFLNQTVNENFLVTLS